MAQSFHTLKISSIDHLTPESVSLTFDLNDDQHEKFKFVPGQFLTLRAVIDGKDERRSYSICSGANEAQIQVGIKRVRDGVFSSYANDVLEPGMTLEVGEPQGRFGLPPTAGAARRVVAFAAGSGITPILSIIKSILVQEEDSQVLLFYGNQRTSTVMFREQLEDLKDRYLTRLEIIHLLSREASDVDILCGRLTPGKLEAFAHAGMIDPGKTDVFLLCGPGDMITGLSGQLQQLGARSDQIRHEQFTPADGQRAPKRVQKDHPSDHNLVEIEAVIDGGQHAFSMSAEDADLIEAAQRAGIEVPFSCRNGMCCTCRCRLVEGDADMALNYSLEPWEMEQGFVLACQLRPRSKKLALDFDAL